MAWKSWGKCQNLICAEVLPLQEDYFCPNIAHNRELGIRPVAEINTTCSRRQLWEGASALVTQRQYSVATSAGYKDTEFTVFSKGSDLRHLGGGALIMSALQGSNGFSGVNGWFKEWSLWHGTC